MHRNTIRRFGVALNVLAFTPACIDIPSLDDTGALDTETPAASDDGADSVADEGPGITSSADGDTGATDTGSDSADSGDTAEAEADSGSETGTAEPTCEDGLPNGTETDVDCGGAACDPCQAQQVCVDDTDCASGVCKGEICQAASCGDGILQAGEECDEGEETKECDLDCTFSECGDAVVNTALGEQCDDAGRTGTCNDNCLLPECGDGITNEAADEVCDDAGESQTCNANCSASSCGDGIPNPTAGEDCDTAGDTASCDSDCTSAACGDGFVNAEAGETCDAEGESAECDADCSPAQCGDGVHNAAAGEGCDDGPDGSETCNADCTVPPCGDGIVDEEAGEECDDNGDLGCDACKRTATHVGSYDVGDGPDWNGDPPTYTCQEACSEVFGEGDYRCSTSDAAVTGTGYYSGWGDGQYCGNAQPDDWKLNTSYDCGAEYCAYSAYVWDHCFGSINHCWKFFDTSEAFSSFDSEGRTVYLFKSEPCQDLSTATTFCEDRGLRWWEGRSSSDAQQLIAHAYSLDESHTWIQVYGATTSVNPAAVDGYPVTVGGDGCVAPSADGWSGFRQWGCSFCDPEQSGGESCCWDSEHPYDWFACEV